MSSIDIFGRGLGVRNSIRATLSLGFAVTVVSAACSVTGGPLNSRASAAVGASQAPSNLSPGLTQPLEPATPNATSPASVEPSGALDKPDAFEEVGVYQFETGHVRDILSFSDGEVWAIGPTEVSQLRPGEMFLHLGWTLGVGDFGKAYLVDDNRVVASEFTVPNGFLVGRTGRHLGVFPGTCGSCLGLFAKDTDGNLWFAKNELVKYDSQAKPLATFSGVTPSVLTASLGDGVFFIDSKKNQILIQRIDRQGIASPVATIPESGIPRHMIVVSKDKLMVSIAKQTGVAIFAVDMISGTIQHVEPPTTGAYFTDVFVDAERQVWTTSRQTLNDGDLTDLNLMGADNKVVFSYHMGTGDRRAWPGLAGIIWVAHNDYGKVESPYPRLGSISTLRKLHLVVNQQEK